MDEPQKTESEKGFPEAQEAPAEVPSPESYSPTEEETHQEKTEQEARGKILKEEVEQEAAQVLAEEEKEKADHQKTEKALDEEGSQEVKKRSRKNKGTRSFFREMMKEKDESEEKTKVPSKDALQIREELAALRDKLNTLKWDHEHGQINPAKKVKLDDLQKRCNELEYQLRKELQQ
ncbi:hypothetical protein J4410_03855 [Candidatus Woesearchaeota archaeon]|nr:hypothetical protein [Candidatus Woesearchaeota archaeon]